MIRGQSGTDAIDWHFLFRLFSLSKWSLDSLPSNFPSSPYHPTVYSISLTPIFSYHLFHHFLYHSVTIVSGRRVTGRHGASQGVTRNGCRWVRKWKMSDKLTSLSVLWNCWMIPLLRDHHSCKFELYKWRIWDLWTYQFENPNYEQYKVHHFSLCPEFSFNVSIFMQWSQRESGGGKD